MDIINTNAPVFIVAPVRSGSTLLHLMLDSHPDIANPGECDFMFDRVTNEGSFPAMGDYRNWLAINRIFLSKGLHTDEGLAYEDLMRTYLEKLHGRKKVLTLNVHRNFQRIPFVFPEARYIHLLRDPRDVARSCIGMGWAGHVYFGADTYMAAERAWDQLKSELKRTQYIEIRYEDLIANCRTVLTAICKFLGVEFSENMLDYAATSSYELPDTSLSYQWKKKYSIRELQLVEGKIGEMIVSRGYELSGHKPIEPGTLELAKLFLWNKSYRIRFNLRKYGLTLYLSWILSKRFGWPSWRESCQKNINKIDILGLK